MRRVLLIGSQRDPHVSVLGARIKELGYDPAVLDAGSLDNTVCCAFRQSRRGETRMFLPTGEEIDCETFGSVWFRLKPVIPLPSWGPLEASASVFAQGEWRTVLRSFNMFLSGARWVNAVEPQTIISSKLRQLNLAASIGFRIPDTTVTNNPTHILNMFAVHKRLVYKALNGFVFPDQTGILTKEIKKEDVLSSPEAIKRAPGIYQEFVEKDYELRVTVVGDKVFPALVRTPRTGDGAIDWRHAHFENIFELCTLDQQISDKLLRFQREAGLRFAAYDLIMDPTGQCFFLECNPAGQFLWLENSLGLPIIDTVARELCAISSS